MTITEAIRKGEKIKTLIEELREGFPEGAGAEMVEAYDNLESAEKTIDEAIDLLASRR